ncbi:MAG: sporulation protein YunB [Ignavibacteriales bacterium]
MVRFRVRRRTGPFSVYPLILAAVFAFFAWRFERSVEPVLMSIAETKASVLATDIINRVVNDTIVSTIKSDQLFTAERNQAGDIVMIRVNTVEVNRLATMAIAAVQDGIRSLPSQEIGIPLGQAMGLRVFSAWGPAIRVQVVPMANVVARISDRFESAGINQVKHCMYLDAEVRLRVMLPFSSSPVIVKSSIPLTTVILPGKVPVTHVEIR